MLATESLFFIPLNNNDDIDSIDDDTTNNDNSSNDCIYTSNDFSESWPLWVWSFSFPGPHSTALMWQWIFSPCAEQLFRSIGIRIVLFVFIGLESDHWLPLSVTNSITYSVAFSRLYWCGPGVWRCQLKTVWGCYCCWCWRSCWQRFVADLGAEVWS